MAAMENVLKLKQVVKARGDFVLKADFEIAKAERAGLAGRSGSGKTTLLRLIAGLEKPDSGKILFGETDITALPPHERGVGYVFQDQALFPSMDVVENAAFGLRMKGVSRCEREERALTWLERVDLKSRAHSPVKQLSGGERQRVAFVRALLWEPRILLLDEPFSALDRDMRGEVRSELAELHRLWPAPMLLVSHDEEDLAALATRRMSLRVATENGVEIRTVSDSL